MCFTYALQYYDKALLSQAAIFGMRDELDLRDHPLRYSNVSMIFYVGYIVGCYPVCSAFSNILDLKVVLMY